MSQARDIKLIVYPVKDLEKGKQFFTKYLGGEPYADSDYYVGFRVGEMEIGLDPNSTAVTPIVYIDVEDIKSFIEELVEIGAEIVANVKEVGGGLLVAQIKDTEGNILGLRQAG